MLLSRVKCDQNLIVGDFVQYDSSAQQFVKCTSQALMMGVVDSAVEQVGSDYVAMIRQAGVATAIAGETLPDDGGPLGIDANGRVIVSTSSDHSCGLIQAQQYGQSARVAGDLVVVWLR